MSTTLMASEKIGLAAVARMTFGVIGRNPVVFLLLPLLIVSLPQIAVEMLLERFLFLGAADRGFATSMPMGIAASLGTSLLNLALLYLLQAALAHAAMADFGGRRVGLAESLGRGLRVLLPVLGTILLFTLGVGLGTLLLIVPGIILFCRWTVSIPAVVVEDLGPVAALRRSAVLSRGNRWRIFFLVLFLVVIGLLLNAVPFYATITTIGTSLSWLATVATALTSALGGALGGAGAAALYAELRRVQEGTTPESLAAVFD